MQFTRRIILTLLIIVLCSALAFASDDSPSPEQAPLEVENAPFTWANLDQAEIMNTAQEIKAVSASSYTTTDIYNLLYSALRGSSSVDTYSLPYIATQVWGTRSACNTMRDHLEVIRSILTGTASGLNPISNINEALILSAGNTTYSQAELTGMIWSLVGDLNSSLSSTNSILANSYNEAYTTNRKLEYVFSAIEDTINIKWYSLGSYLGVSLNYDTNFLNTRTVSRTFKGVFDLSDFSNYPCIYRFFVPVFMNSYNFDGAPPILISHVAYNGSSVHSPDFDYFTESTPNGTYFYLIDFSKRLNGIFQFEFTSSSDMTFNPDYAGNVFFVPFDTLDYQIIKTAFNQAKTANSLEELNINVSSGSLAAEALADYFVSPQKQAAEDASQQVINSTLNNFTGSGSGAAKSSDSNAMKDVSGSLQSGLNAGGSVSGATGVFNSSGDFWKWFSQENSNYINNPYPAPVVTPTRGSGDEIVDFLTPNSNELQDLLRQGGDQR